MLWWYDLSTGGLTRLMTAPYAAEVGLPALPPWGAASSDSGGPFAHAARQRGR